MPKPRTRQQRRARSRSPMRKRRSGSIAFLITILLVVAMGIGGIFYFRLNKPPLTRGAIAGEHWHAKYTIYVCGKQMSAYPNVEGELHSHADGFIHIHPHSQAFAGDRANLGAFLATYETALTEQAGKRQLTFPDGTSYEDGDRCPNDKKRYDIEVTNRGEEVEGDPSVFIPHDGDEVVIAFGPEGKETFPNPYAKAKGIPDPGAVGGATPVPDDAAPPEPVVPPATSPEPEGTAEPEPEATAE